MIARHCRDCLYCKIDPFELGHKVQCVKGHWKTKEGHPKCYTYLGCVRNVGSTPRVLRAYARDCPDWNDMDAKPVPRRKPAGCSLRWTPEVMR